MAAEVGEEEWIRKGNAKLRYYLHIADPDSLSDEEWAARLRDLDWIWEAERASAEKQKNTK